MYYFFTYLTESEENISEVNWLIVSNMSDASPPRKKLRSITKEVYLVEKEFHQIMGSKLPSIKQVFSVFFFNTRTVKLSTRESVNLVLLKQREKGRPGCMVGIDVSWRAPPAFILPAKSQRRPNNSKSYGSSDRNSFRRRRWKTLGAASRICSPVPAAHPKPASPPWLANYDERHTDHRDFDWTARAALDQPQRIPSARRVVFPHAGVAGLDRKSVV